MKTVRLMQGLWCNCGRHVITKGDEYVILADGRISCPEHQHLPPPEVDLAGSLA